MLGPRPAAVELERQVSLLRGALPSARVIRFDYYCQDQPVPPSFFFSSYLFFFYLRFFQRDASKTNEDARGAFCLGEHARTHARTSPVRAARATRVCGPHMYASSSTFNRVGEFKCDQRGRGLASATSFIASRLVQLPFARTPFLLRELFGSRKSSQFGRAWYGGHAAVQRLEIFILLVKQIALLSSSV